MYKESTNSDEHIIRRLFNGRSSDHHSESADANYDTPFRAGRRFERILGFLFAKRFRSHRLDLRSVYET